AASLIPSPTSSPWTRRYPQLGFSASETHHERTHLGGSPRASGRTMRIRPASRDKLAMPAHKGRRRDEQRRLPRSPRHDAAERCEQRPISLRQLRTGDLTLQYRQLVTQQKDLDLFLLLRTTPEHDQLEQPAQRPVHQRKNHAARTTLHRS